MPKILISKTFSFFIVLLLTKGTTYQKNASAQIVAYADKATKRIRTKMKKLEDRGTNYNVASAAGYERTCMFCMGNDERQNCLNSLFIYSKV